MEAYKQKKFSQSWHYFSNEHEEYLSAVRLTPYLVRIVVNLNCKTEQTIVLYVTQRHLILSGEKNPWADVPIWVSIRSDNAFMQLFIVIQFSKDVFSMGNLGIRQNFPRFALNVNEPDD
ncbi:hypothetical protein ACTXT7_010056 [Hymenolepis weldensis]